jgi:transposase-like protein
MSKRSSTSLKPQGMQEFLLPGGTMSGIAISHGINANIILRRLPIYLDKSPAPVPAYVPL